MNRLTTDTPKGNYQMLHNCTVVKEHEVYLRDWNGEGDISLVNFCKAECKRKCDTNIEAGAEEFGEYMDCDCFVAHFYHTAVGHAELRERLKAYEDSNLSPEQLCEYSAPRTEVLAFAKAMELELIENRNKGTWKNCSVGYLLDKLSEEHQELYDVMVKYVHAPSDQKESMLKEILSEAADVGNIAMMLADICGAL